MECTLFLCALLVCVCVVALPLLLSGERERERQPRSICRMGSMKLSSKPDAFTRRGQAWYGFSLCSLSLSLLQVQFGFCLGLVSCMDASWPDKELVNLMVLSSSSCCG